jgi:adenylate cyclase
MESLARWRRLRGGLLIPGLAFGSFRARIASFVLGLLLVVLGLVFFAVNRASIDNALERINSDLDATAVAFQRVLDTRNQNLLERARFLSSDHAYRQIYAFGEREDLELVTDNHRRRIGADLMMLVSMEEEVLADTLHTGGEETIPASVVDLLNTALDSDNGEARAMMLVDGLPYQLVVVPLYAPEPVALVVLGFRIDAALAEQLKTDTGSTDISLVFDLGGASPVTAACTLGPRLCEQQMAQLRRQPPVAGRQSDWMLAGEPWIARVLPLGAEGSGNLAVLQRSLERELASYYGLRDTLLLVFGGVMLLSALGVSVLSGTVTRPVATLAKGAQRIARGEYDARVEIPQRDELGGLADAFNDMAQGLLERDQVRNLLGKVVSPQIADELLGKDLELGGEEVEATILFSDIRSFTDISETMSPQQVIQMLNYYLTEMNRIIEDNHGVVDKYIGDAIMAIFGAPLAHPDSPGNAVRSAMRMQEAMTDLNVYFSERQIPEFSIGIGINSGNVVAGNMGSMSRLNYTVLGDAVNLASRIEGLCKTYAVPIVISETTRAACPDVVCRELDRVRVKGKSRSVTLYQPMQDLGPGELAALEQYQQALEAYRARDWALAQGLFEDLERGGASTLYRVYLDRIAHFRETPPGEDWDGVFAFSTK